MFVGDNSVGKTSIIFTFTSNEPLISKPDATHDVDIYFKKIKVKDDSVFVNVNSFPILIV
jgi:hypothetical protein